MTDSTTPEPTPTAPVPQPSPPSQPPERKRFGSGFATARDLITFLAGLAFVGNEVFISSTAEPAIIAVGVTMMGLPLVFGADERKRGGGGNSGGGDTGGDPEK